MDQLQQFARTSRAYTYILIVLSNMLAVTTYWVVQIYFTADAIALSAALIVALVTPLVVTAVISSFFMQPLTFLWQAILYIAPENSSVAAPDINKARHGKALITNLVNHVYQLADVSTQVAQVTAKEQDSAGAQFITNLLPIPVAILDKDQNILFANHELQKHFGEEAMDTTGKNIYSLLNLSFQSEDTLEKWLKATKAKSVTSTKIWRRVKLQSPEETGESVFFDLAAYYNKANPAGYETVLALFDQTDTYGKDEQDVDFVSLVVHELRTSITMLRGYIEVIEEEVEQTADDELKEFLQKTRAAAAQLAAFVNNILNVARIEDGQMLLRLQEENWSETLSSTLDNLSLRAKVYGITIQRNIADNLPTVGIDRVSMYQVMSNLIDNAIKYSKNSKEIVVTTKLTSDGLVETTVEDFGVGIPQSAVQKLFTKFYRDHRNKSQVGGTGLGLYLCKTIIKAHEGNIWVRSKEGEGSTFGFTVLPYSELADELKNNDNKDIVRNAHGWIKNHSLYRR